MTPSEPQDRLPYLPKIDLSVPKLNTGQGPGTSRDKSRSEAKLLRGFYENVLFVPWPAGYFEALTDTALKALDGIDSYAMVNLQNRLSIAKSHINMVVAGRGLGARKAVVGGGTKTGGESSVSPEHAEGNQESAPAKLKPGTEKRNIKQVSFDVPSEQPIPVDNRKMFSTSTSVDPVNNDIFSGLLDAFRSTLPYKDDQNEWFGIITKEYRLPLNENDFKLSPSSRGRKQTADKSLVRMIENTQCGGPLCAYEFKGPRMDFQLFALEYHKYHACLKELLKKRECTGKSVDADIPRFKKSDIPDDREGPELVSAEIMCEFFNGMFGTMDNCYSETRNRFVSEDKLSPIAQTLSQGLCTQSGICLLYTHQQSVGFQIDGNTTFV